VSLISPRQVQAVKRIGVPSIHHSESFSARACGAAAPARTGISGFVRRARPVMCCKAGIELAR